MRLGIRTKLLGTVCPLLIVACGAVAGVAAINGRQALRVNAGESLTNMAQQGARLIQARLQTQAAAMQAVANRHVIRSMDWTQQAPVLQEEAARLELLAMAIVMPDGQARYADGATADLAGRSYLNKALAGETNVSSVIISRVTNSAVMMIATPVHDAEGRIIAALVGRMPATILSDVTDTIRYGAGGYAYIIDDKGTLIAHDDRDLVLDQRNFIHESESDPQFARLAQMMRRMTAGETGFEEYEFKGTVRFFGFAPIEGTGWSIAVGAERSFILASERKMLAAVMIAAVAAVLIAGTVMWIMAAGITRPILQTTRMLKDIAEGDGDLTQRLQVSSRDEIRELATYFNRFVQNMHDLIAAVAESAQDVASASTQIAAASEEIAQGIEEQSRRSDEVLAASQEMSTAVTEVAHQSSEANRSAATAGDRASDGEKIVGQAVEGMTAIASVVDESAQAIGELGRLGEQIGSVISVINDIADQTNLLALNAAIEAARAGEHGRGFAVVADEVRKLADRTTEATEEIGQSIRAIQNGTEQAVDSMNTGAARVTDGVALVQRTGEALRAIVTASGEVATQIRSIAAASEEQSATATQITASIDGIKAISAQAAEGAHQSAAATAQLSRRAEQLQGLVGRFKLHRSTEQRVA